MHACLPVLFCSTFISQVGQRFDVTGSELTACECPFLARGDCATTRLLLAQRYPSSIAADITLQLMGHMDTVCGAYIDAHN